MGHCITILLVNFLFSFSKYLFPCIFSLVIRAVFTISPTHRLLACVILLLFHTYILCCLLLMFVLFSSVFFSSIVIIDRWWLILHRKGSISSMPRLLIFCYGMVWYGMVWAKSRSVFYWILIYKNTASDVVRRMIYYCCKGWKFVARTYYIVFNTRHK